MVFIHKYKNNTNRRCQIENCNNKIPEEYPVYAVFCEEHKCQHTEFESTNRHLKRTKSCYLNRMSDSVTTCEEHICEHPGCFNAQESYQDVYRLDTYCDLHSHNKTSAFYKLAALTIGTCAVYIYFFM